ncbi:MAG: hypothetical protein MRZ79_04755 [Bacteroidia bacterium]|nr:hypothetical protein [Bacteroidia bacterium]
MAKRKSKKKSGGVIRKDMGAHAGKFAGGLAAGAGAIVISAVVTNKVVARVSFIPYVIQPLGVVLIGGVLEFVFDNHYICRAGAGMTDYGLSTIMNRALDKNQIAKKFGIVEERILSRDNPSSNAPSGNGVSGLGNLDEDLLRELETEGVPMTNSMVNSTAMFAQVN